MTGDLGKDIRTLFAKSVLEHEAARHLNADERTAYRKIKDDHAAMVRFEERQFELEFQTRFEVARKEIIDQRAAKDRTFAPRWFGSDTFDQDAIDRQAVRLVHQQHAQQLARLGEERDERVNALLSAAGERQDAGAELRRQFKQSADRLSGREHRRSR